MNVDSVQPRVLCAICRRTHSTCICQWVRPQSTAVEVVILQHPLEVREAKGTGRLLHLSLAGSVLIAGETLTDTALERIADPQRRSVLLYPDQIGSRATVFSDRTQDGCLHNLAGLRLIVLDATWRKSRKMLHLNPLLGALPRVALRAPPPSRYAIRKAHHPHQLSTLEATCHMLLQLGESPDALHALLQSFDGFIAQQEFHRKRSRSGA